MILIQGYDKQGGMEKSEISKISLNRRLIYSRWVFNNKIGGRYRSHLVTLEYTQIIGVDFTKN